MAVDECRGSVVFAKQAAVDVVEPIPGDEPVPAGGTCEALRGGGGGGQRKNRSQPGPRTTRQRSILLCNNTLEQTHTHICTSASVCAGVSGG